METAELKFQKIISGCPVPSKYKNKITASVGDINPKYWDTFHRGTDFGVPEGTPVYCGRYGTVVHSSNDGGKEGLYISIDCLTEYDIVRYLYFHLSRADVKVGQKIKEGQMIGLSGKTGNAYGPHLHYQIHKGSGLQRVFYVPDFK